MLLGKDNQVRLAVACLLAHGHLLIEDLPGVGKITLAEALARSFGLDWKRVSFTSDLLPADLNGVDVFDPASGRFQFQSEPLFSQVLQADEINRASPRTQSALLEAMVAGRVSSPAWRPWPAADPARPAWVAPRPHGKRWPWPCSPSAWGPSPP